VSSLEKEEGKKTMSSHYNSHIQQVVRVLSIFVPGQNQDQHQIIEWFEEKERLTDAEIGSIKLVGLAREIIDSSIHKLDSSCVFDIDSNHGHLESSPVYIEGQWINQLLDRIMLFTSDASYLAYLHTVFMTMSLKAFVYHHLYVCDEFHQHTTTSGYVSEAGSTSSAVARKWSVRRIMNYLKRIEERENKENGYDELPPSDIVSTTSESYLMTDDEDEDFFTAETQRTSEKTEDEDEDEDYAEENQATVTLESLQKEQPNKSLTTIFPDLQMNTATSSKPVARTEGSVSTTYSNNNISGYFDYVPPGDYYTNDDSSEYSSSSNEEVDEVRPDGMTYIEQRGRQYLQDKLKVYGDDQTIVVVSLYIVGLKKGRVG
jgi:hypothetical protein